MLKILNNDKFTTAQNRHSLVSLKIPILNTLPFRAKVRAKVWANGWLLLLPLQGAGAVRTLTQGVALGSELVGLSARAGPPVCPEPRKFD